MRMTITLDGSKRPPAGVRGLIFWCGLAVLFSGCGRADHARPAEVVVYASVDAVYARPIADLFTQRSGIAVKLVSDTEETKSTGLLNRLLAEKTRPQADVFWSGDPVRSAVLKTKQVSAPYSSPEAAGLPARYSDPEHHYIGFSARLRVLVVNRNLLRPEDRPRSLLELAEPRFAAKTCLANPLFGTTSMHVAALFQVLGDERARQFFDQLARNGVHMLSSNGEVRRRVALGDFAIGLTDSDDASGAIKDGQPIDVVLPDQDGIGTLLIPNAVSLIARAPHGESARQFIDFLVSPEVERMLAESDAAQIPLRSGIPAPAVFGQGIRQIRTMQVDYTSLAVKLEELNAGYLAQWTEHQMSR